MDNLPILEMDLSKRTSDLRTQFDAVDRQNWPSKPIRASTSRTSGLLTVTCAGGICPEAAWPPSRCEKPTQKSAASAITAVPTTQDQAEDRAAPERLGPSASGRSSIARSPCSSIGRPATLSSIDTFVSAHIFRGLGKNVNAAELVEKLVPHRCSAFVIQREGKSVTSSNAHALKERRPSLTSRRRSRHRHLATCR